MVDAGLMCWELGRKEEAKSLYARAAEMGYPAAQCNLGLCYLQGNSESFLFILIIFNLQPLFYLYLYKPPAIYVVTPDFWVHEAL